MSTKPEGGAARRTARARPPRADYLGPARRRPLVVEAALHLVVERGFESASMSMIGRRAEVSKAVLYDCFPAGKRDLMMAVIDRAERALLDAMRSHQGVPLALALSDPTALRLVFGAPEPLDPLLAARLRAARRAVDDAIGLLPDDMAGEGLPARLFHAMVRELVRWLAEDPTRDVASAGEIWRDLVLVFGAQRRSFVA